MPIHRPPSRVLLAVAPFLLLLTFMSNADAQEAPASGSLVPGTSSRATNGESGSRMARGIVYHDANGNRRFDSGEAKLSGIRVSNGREIALTDFAGAYRLPVDDDDILFVIKPRGWKTPIDKNQLPRFYYIHKPNGSPKLQYPGVEPTGPLPESVDFPLYRQEEPEHFKAILFGDPQPRNKKELDYIAHDVVEDLVGTDASFGVTLGDITFDDLSLFEPQAQVIALLGIPWYNVIGNHDINYDASNDAHSDEVFERVFGPAYYSFDYGPVHFLVLDDVRWHIADDGNGKYVGGLGEEQMRFIRSDLQHILADQLVVLMMHIPLTDVEDRHQLYRLIETRPFCISISGHTHYHEHRFITDKDGWKGPEPHHHIINVTVSGSWWSGAPDERGIPHTTMADGVPNGYSIISFDGQKYKLDYRAAGRDPNFQMQITAPDEVALNELESTTVYVNVFNGSVRSKVEMRVGDRADWYIMNYRPGVDPAYQATFDREQSLAEKPWRDLSKPRTTKHLWQASLPADLSAGTYFLHVRTTDMHGSTFHGRRVIVIREP